MLIGKTMTNATIYCRFSPRPDADTSTSNERQEERCRLYCEVKSYDVLSVFYDRDISGGTIDRPELTKAIDSLKEGDVLVCDAADRLARDMLVSLIIQQRVSEAGARIEYADGTPPDTTPEGELVRNILGAFAQYQRATIRKKTKAGLARKRASGMHLGPCPIGYLRDAQGKLIPDPDEQLLISNIMGMWVDEQRPISSISRIMQMVGPIRGKPWNERTIRRIIARETIDNREI
jgi:DNA invertase Pin-like site-specific DNA recombinase